MNTNHLGFALSVLIASTANAQSGAFPPPRVMLAEVPASGQPLVYGNQNLELEDSIHFAMRTELDGATSETQWTWVMVIPRIEVTEESSLWNQYAFLQPLPANQMSALHSQLVEHHGSQIDATDLQALASSTLTVSSSIVYAAIHDWLSPANTVREYAQVVAQPTTNPATLDWLYLPANWDSGAGIAQREFWGRAADGRIEVAPGDSRILYDTESLVDECAQSQAAMMGTTELDQYSALRNDRELWPQLLADYSLKLQAVAVRGASPTPSDFSLSTQPIRLSLSQPVEIIVTVPNPGNGTVNPHPDPLLSELLGIPNPPYFAFAGQRVFLYMVNAFPGMNVIFDTHSGPVSQPLQIEGPCLVSVVVPSNTKQSTHFDVFDTVTGMQVVTGDDTEYGTSLWTEPAPPSGTN